MTTQKTVGLVVYAFGTPCSNSSNSALAGYVQNLIQKSPEIRFRIYTQNDIQFEDTECLNVAYFPQLHDEAAPPTLRIARGAAQWARHQVDEVFVVAATPHRWRALRDTRKAFQEAVVNIPIQLMKFHQPDYMHDKGLFSYDYQAKGIIGDDTSYWFDPNGTQIRAASRSHWEKRERILRFMPYPLYRIVAK
jgi:hypothetical protein